MDERSASIRVGVVIRRQPGVTRWAKWVWRAVAVLPGADDADWRELRREGEAVEYHASTCTLEVFRTDTEAYLTALANEPPSVYVILRPTEDPEAERDYEVWGVTASPFEAQDMLDSGDEIVEPVPMPPALIAWLSDFVGRHHVDTPFVKRQRGPRVEASEGDGKGDPRVRQAADVFRSPGSRRKEGLH